MSRAVFRTLAEYPVPAGRFWAKLSDDPPDWHPLLAHCADVAAVANCLLTPPSPLAARLAGAAGMPRLTDDLRGRLTGLAAAHDLGKVQRGFQQQALPPTERNQAFPPGHLGVLLTAMGQVVPLRRLILDQLLPYLAPDLRQAAEWWQLTIAHHGRPLGLMTAQTAARGAWSEEALNEAARLLRCARNWGGISVPAADPLPDYPAFSHLFAGLLTLADWLGSTDAAFPFWPAADEDPDGYWLRQAVPQARRACAEVGLVPETVAVSLAGLPLLEQVFPRTFIDAGHRPTPLQALSSEMKLPAPGSRILIESSTGSGKTEAVLALYARLRAAGRVGGLMFALPTRATASSMYDRVRAALAGIYAGDTRPTVALAVGGQQPRNESDNQLLSGADQLPEPEDGDELRHWASAQAKRFLAAEIVVGTLDQVLLAGLAVKHAHLRLAALARHLLVVDELHSYDTYMAEVLNNVLAVHATAGGVTALLSATLAERERRRFGGGEILPRAEAAARAYPSLGLCPIDGEWGDVPLESHEPTKYVEWRLLAWTEATAAAVRAAEQGARVLLLRNTVKDLRAARGELFAADQEALLWQPEGSEHRPGYHSRYTGPDRQWLDAAVTARFGKSAATQPGGCLLLATQVAEQSLDIDFDFLVTDLCPIDVLLQRIGRLHRHLERQGHRPGAYATPQVIVVEPAGKLATSAQPGGGWGVKNVYEDLATAELTRRTILAHETIELPALNRALIEAVYHPSVRQALGEEPAWQTQLKAEAQRQRTFRTRARDVILELDRPYLANADRYDFLKKAEVAVRTRLGDERIRVELPDELPNRYASGHPGDRHVDLPIWVAGKATVASPSVTSTGTGYAVNQRGIWYDEDGWHW